MCAFQTHLCSMSRGDQRQVTKMLCVPQEDAVIEGKDLVELYPYVVNDQGFDLRSRPFNLTVAWNVMPLVGEFPTC